MSRVLLALLLGATLALGAACSSPARDEISPAPTEPAAVPTSTTAPAPTATSEPTATPSPTVTPSPTSSPTPTLSPTATATPEPTATLTPEPPTLAITELNLHDIDGSPLQFLSVDEHPLFGGFTPVHGTLAIEGVGEVASVTLEIADAATGALVEVPLAAAAGEQLILPFGDTGRLSILSSQALFEIPSAAFAEFDKMHDGYVELTVRVTATDGREARYQSPAMQTIGKLVLYTAENRYFVGEEEQGGNSWVTPGAKTLAEQLPDVQYGDFSNINGGPFPPHISHQRGVDIDGWFFGYNELDAVTAQELLDRLNHPGVIERIQLVFVTYQQVAGDPFWEAIRDVTLVDGRSAAEVFLPELEHDAHFHLRLRE